MLFHTHTAVESSGSSLCSSSLVVLAFVLCDVELRVQVVQQGVGTFLTQRVVHVCLAGHDVEQVTGHLGGTGSETAYLSAVLAKICDQSNLT